MTLSEAFDNGYSFTDRTYQRGYISRKNDTPETLQKRVMRLAEWKILPASAEKVCADIIKKRTEK